jgi:hypothetical protein
VSARGPISRTGPLAFPASAAALILMGLATTLASGGEHNDTPHGEDGEDRSQGDTGDDSLRGAASSFRLRAAQARAVLRTAAYGTNVP